MTGQFEIKKTKDGEFYFHLRAENQQIILVSERYETKGSAENGIASVKKNAPEDGRYERKDAKNGEFMFNLKAANHLVIGTSEMYTTVSARDNGIASVKVTAPMAPVADLTV
jgi:uncharacterized protein YegP (UPF0339 family)